MKNVTFRKLQSLLAIETHRKIVDAAKAFGLTAPAITLQLKQLEEDAGVTLFERMPHGMFPTEAGKVFLEAAKEIDERLQRLADDINAFRRVKRGHITVGAVSTVRYFAAPLFAAFSKEYPDIHLELIIDRRDETIARLKDRAVDIALLGRPPRDISVRAAVFGEHSLVVVSAPGHALAGKRDITKAEIANEHFLHRGKGSGTRTFFERFLKDIPGRLDGPSTEMETVEAIKQAVMADLGIAFLSMQSVAAEVQAGQLAVLDVVGLPIRRQWFAISRSDRAVTPVMAAFQAFLATRGEMFLPNFGDPAKMPA